MKSFSSSLCLGFILISLIQSNEDGIAFVKYQGSNNQEQQTSQDNKTNIASSPQFKPNSINCVFVLKNAEANAAHILTEAKSVFSELSVPLKTAVNNNSSVKVEDGNSKSDNAVDKNTQQTPNNNNNNAATPTEQKNLRILEDPKAPETDNQVNAAPDSSKTGENKTTDNKDAKPVEKQKIVVALICNYPNEGSNAPKSIERFHTCNEGKVSINYKRPKTRVEDAIVTSQSLATGEVSGIYVAVKEFPYSAENLVEYTEKTCTLNVSSINILKVFVVLVTTIASLY